MVFSLENPIPREVKDPDDLQEWMRTYRVIPYYGDHETSSQQFLFLLKSLCDLSPTFGAVMRDRKQYTFGLNPIITQRNIPGLAGDDLELSFEEQRDFVFYLKELGIGLPKINDVGRKVEHHLQQCGNAYLLVKRFREGDAVRYRVDGVHFLHFLYVESDDPGEWFGLVSRFLGDVEKMAKYPPKLVRVTRYGEHDELRWMMNDEGYEETLIHIMLKENEDEGVFYGRPGLLAFIDDLYVTGQMGNLRSKIAATEIISKLLLAMEAPNPNTLPRKEFEESEVENNGEFDGSVISSGKILAYGKRPPMSMFEQNMWQIRELVSALGDHPTRKDYRGKKKVTSLGGVEYPNGGKPPVAIPLEINRDTEYHRYQTETSDRVVAGGLGWSVELMGYQEANATLGGNMLYDLFVMRNVTTIIPNQRMHADIWNFMLGEIVREEGMEGQFGGLGIAYKDVISEMIDKLKGEGAEGGQVRMGEEVNRAANSQEPAQQINDDGSVDDGE